MTVFEADKNIAAGMLCLKLFDMHNMTFDPGPPVVWPTLAPLSIQI
jgi:hypothetical protein